VKFCSKCRKWKSDDEMSKDSRRLDGLGSFCRSCKSKSSQRWQEANPDKKQATQRKWRSDNIEKVRAGARKWVAQNPDKVREIGRKWRQENPERANKRSSKWKQSHLDKVRECWKNWYQANVERVSEYGKKQRKAHPEKVQEHAHNRRARIKGSEGTIIAEEWRELKEKYNYTCLCCGRREPEIKLTLDHVVPLFVGGSNTIGNAQPLCKSCNSSKSVKVIDYRKEYSHE
jgi:5-methylcytosine-specific restriction endonuclease McrA